MTQYLNPVWGCQLFFIGHLTRWRIGERSLGIEGIVEIKYPERSCKLSYHGLPTGNQDLGRSGNCRWEAAHAKLTTGGGECNHYSFRSETDRRGWEPSCRLSAVALRCGRKGRTTTLWSQSSNQSVMMNASSITFSGNKILPQSDLRVGKVSNRIIKKVSQENRNVKYKVISSIRQTGKHKYRNETIECRYSRNEWNGMGRRRSTLERQIESYILRRQNNNTGFELY